MTLEHIAHRDDARQTVLDIPFAFCIAPKLSFMHADGWAVQCCRATRSVYRGIIFEAGI